MIGLCEKIFLSDPSGTDINACPIARGKCEREKNDFGQVNGRLEKPERSS